MATACFHDEEFKIGENGRKEVSTVPFPWEKFSSFLFQFECNECYEYPMYGR